MYAARLPGKSDLYVPARACNVCAGLLATQSGSVGRLVGNFGISVFGLFVAGTVALSNVMYLTFTGFVGLCLVLYGISYSKLQRSKEKE